MTPDMVITCARSWIGTPYHHMARVKGGGVDCAQLIIAAFVEAGVNEDFDPGFYTMDWHLHKSEERYLNFIKQYMVQIDEDYKDAPLETRGDWCPPRAAVIAIRLGRTFSHSALVTDYPHIIHSNVQDGFVLECSAKGSMLETRPMRTFVHRSLVQ